MKSLRKGCTGRWPVHSCSRAATIAAAALIAAGPVAATAAAPARPVAAAPLTTGQSVEDFYRARGESPLWLGPRAGDSAQQLISLLATSGLDGLNPDRYQASALHQALEKARSGKRKHVAEAERRLSAAFAAFVADLRRDPPIGTLYVDPDLKPKPPSPLAALLAASAAPSLADHVRTLGWMNPIYGKLRQALANRNYASEEERQRLALNLERARALPAGNQRYVLVNAAQQRLYMVEKGQVVDSMRVVVGKPKYPTPMMSAYIRFASLNPYWFVPPDLAAERIAPRVLKQGIQYLDELGYQVLSEWSANPEIIDPKTIDWKAVAEGKTEVFIRQLPGPHNSMGRMKFMFPNEYGIYLHDNPERELFEQAARLYSGGCVRLEDAPRLGRWLYGRDLEWDQASTEQMVPLRDPVPVYITYLTAMPEGSSIAYFEDVYGRDKARLAALDPGPATSSAAAGR